MDESSSASKHNAAAVQAKQEEMDDDVQLRQHHMQMQAQADAQAQQFAMFQQPEYSAESQAQLHHHYASLAAQPSFPHSAAQLSYTPAPELVADALQRAAYERSVNPSCASPAPSPSRRKPLTSFAPLVVNPMAMDHSLQHLVPLQGDTGTPSGLAMSDVHGRLASFALSSQPMTLDPSNMM